MNAKFLMVMLLGATMLLPGCFRTRSDIAKEKEEQEMRAALQKNAVEYNQGIEKMQAEIGRLQGKIEELEHQRKKELNAVSSSTEGNAKTVSELKGRMEELTKTQAMLFEEIKRLKEENMQLLKNLSQPAAQSPGGAKKKGTGASYTGALKAYKARDYDTAAEGFRAYLQKYPKGKNILSARYHLADILFRRKDYADAIVEFGVIHESSPKSTLGRKSTLRIAESFKALGKDKDAKAFAQILVQTSPSSAEARQARKFLK